MFGAILRQLIERGLTTPRELQEVTGRGASTVYRWTVDQSEPDFKDLRAILRDLDSSEGRRTIASALLADSPVVVNWIGEANQIELTAEERRRTDGDGALSVSLLALEQLSQLLDTERRAHDRRATSEDQAARAIDLIDATVRYLTISKQIIAKDAGKRRQAKPFEDA